jgi:hypothetical protein
MTYTYEQHKEFIRFVARQFYEEVASKQNHEDSYTI